MDRSAFKTEKHFDLGSRTGQCILFFFLLNQRVFLDEVSRNPAKQETERGVFS